MGAFLSIVRDARAWKRYYDTKGVAAAKDDSWIGRLVATESVVQRVTEVTEQPVVVEMNARLQDHDYKIYDRFRKHCILVFGSDEPKTNEMKFVFLGTPEGTVEPIMTTGSPTGNLWDKVQLDHDGFSTSLDSCLSYCGRVPDQFGDYKIVVFVVINAENVKCHRKMLGARGSYHSLPVAIVRVQGPNIVTSNARNVGRIGPRSTRNVNFEASIPPQVSCEIDIA